MKLWFLLQAVGSDFTLRKPSFRMGATFRRLLLLLTTLYLILKIRDLFSFETYDSVLVSQHVKLQRTALSEMKLINFHSQEGVILYFLAKDEEPRINKLALSIQALQLQYNEKSHRPIYIFLENYSQEVMTQILMKLSLLDVNQHLISFFPLLLPSKVDIEPLYPTYFPRAHQIQMMRFVSLFWVC